MNSIPKHGEETFFLSEDPVTGEPLGPDPQVPQPVPYFDKPGVFKKNATRLINRHKRGGGNADA